MLDPCSLGNLFLLLFFFLRFGLTDTYPQDELFDWRKEFETRYLCGKKVRHFVASMSSKYFLRDEVSLWTVSPFESPDTDKYDILQVLIAVIYNTSVDIYVIYFLMNLLLLFLCRFPKKDTRI